MKLFRLNHIRFSVEEHTMAILVISSDASSCETDDIGWSFWLVWRDIMVGCIWVSWWSCMSSMIILSWNLAVATQHERRNIHVAPNRQHYCVLKLWKHSLCFFGYIGILAFESEVSKTIAKRRWMCCTKAITWTVVQYVTLQEDCGDWNQP